MAHPSVGELPNDVGHLIGVDPAYGANKKPRSERGIRHQRKVFTSGLQWWLQAADPMRWLQGVQDVPSVLCLPA